MATSTAADVQACTIIQVTNLHCDRCISTVKLRLASLHPALSVDASLKTQTVTVKHPKGFSATELQHALCEAGFDISSCERCADEIASHDVRLQKHSEYCLQCRTEQALPTFSVTLSVSGMTCSSCAITISEVISRISGVHNATVNVLDGFAEAIIVNKDLADSVFHAIEDCGFEARILNVEPLQDKELEQPIRVQRTVSLRIHAMFSQTCADKVMAALEGFGDSVTIVKPVLVHTDPVLTISYLPDPPNMSIRKIITSITSTRSPPLQVTVERPPSIEQLARAMQLRERRHIWHRLLFAFIAALPTFVIGIVYMSLVQDGNRFKTYLSEPIWVRNVSRAEWALFFISTPVMFYSASFYHWRTLKEIYAIWRPGNSMSYLERFTRFGTMNMLVSLGVSVSYFSSIGLLCLETRTPGHQTGKMTTYFDSVVFLTMFLLAGRYTEAYCKARTADAVSALASLRPVHAYLLVPLASGNELFPTIFTRTEEDIEKGSVGNDVNFTSQTRIEKVSVDHLEVGDVVRIPSGSTPPADGNIISGHQGVFDESSLTGESKLIKKLSGDKVFAGTVNKGQPLDIEIQAIGSNTMLDNIIKVVREGQTRRAPIERVADHIVRYFVPIVTALAVITWIIWLALGFSNSLPLHDLDLEIGGWTVWSLQFAVAVFVVACPCGIGLAAPTALLVGLGLSAKFGILARGGGEAFQEMSQIDLVVFDKTGTVTEGGQPRVSDFVILNSTLWSRSTVLGVAAELESISSHPLATAIRQFSGNSVNETGSMFEEAAGKGLKAFFPSLNCTAIIGNEVWMLEHGASINSELSKRLTIWKEEAKSVVLLAIQLHQQDAVFHIAAIFAVSDPVRNGAKEVISHLNALEISSWMISGDNFTTASAVARTIGIPADHVIAGVLPHEKSLHIERLQNSGFTRSARSRKPHSKTRTIVAMVGDGINDAPALAVADVGIAIGSGSDIALSSASFVLLSSDLRSLITLYDLSKCIINRIKFNFGWALIYNMIALPIAAGVIYPTGHRLDPVWASLAMALSSASVVCSSLLLKRYNGVRAFN
ncbi:putative copper-transporting ATPase 3 [Termitomyces sp. T112]|nr:putative copper-transporting ATPase 3 [Termitomyces sp. T112]